MTGWDEVRHFGREENINFIPIAIGDLLRAKTLLDSGVDLLVIDNFVIDKTKEAKKFLWSPKKKFFEGLDLYINWFKKEHD